mmetsp:Transcript_135118/g.376435  ORF Transcript_135118/g.376435 Transcript_135118/m.376435 type:complete len:214 (+) Transcript_135118:413-1054(+)
MLPRPPGANAPPPRGRPAPAGRRLLPRPTRRAPGPPPPPTRRGPAQPRAVPCLPVLRRRVLCGPPRRPPHARHSGPPPPRRPASRPPGPPAAHRPRQPPALRRPRERRPRRLFPAPGRAWPPRRGPLVRWRGPQQRAGGWPPPRPLRARLDRGVLPLPAPRRRGEGPQPPQRGPWRRTLRSPSPRGPRHGRPSQGVPRPQATPARPGCGAPPG